MSLVSHNFLCQSSQAGGTLVVTLPHLDLSQLAVLRIHFELEMCIKYLLYEFRQDILFPIKSLFKAVTYNTCNF